MLASSVLIAALIAAMHLPAGAPAMPVGAVAPALQGNQGRVPVKPFSADPLRRDPWFLTVDPLSPYYKKFRGPSSRELLKIDWRYPVAPQGETLRAIPAGSGKSKQVARPLDVPEVFRTLSGADRRPLLIYRDCIDCEDAPQPLLRPDEDNERTMILLRWFDCIRLPETVLGPSHLYHGVYAGAPDALPIVVCRWDGAELARLKREPSRAELHSVLEARLLADYVKPHGRSLRLLLKLLDDLDQVDQELTLAKDRFDESVETQGPGSTKLRKLSKDIEEARTEREKLLVRVEKLSELEARHPPPAPPRVAGKPVSTAGGTD